MSGRGMPVSPDGILSMSPEDAKALLGIGWKRVEPDMVVIR